MAKSRLNELYANYLASPVDELEPLLTEVRKVALRMYGTEDGAQQFTLDIWQILPDLKITASFAAYIHQFAVWRRIDFYRRTRKLVESEQQTPDMIGEDGEPMPTDEALDALQFRYLSAQPRPEPEPDLDLVEDPFIKRVAEQLLFGHTQDEIAERMKIKPATLRKRLQRYRERSVMVAAA